MKFLTQYSPPYLNQIQLTKTIMCNKMRAHQQKIKPQKPQQTLLLQIAIHLKIRVLAQTQQSFKWTGLLTILAYLNKKSPQTSQILKTPILNHRQLRIVILLQAVTLRHPHSQAAQTPHQARVQATRPRSMTMTPISPSISTKRLPSMIVTGPTIGISLGLTDYKLLSQ